MNFFQKKTIVRAMEAINEVARGERLRHYFNEQQRNLILEINLKPDDYIISEIENHQLNEIRQKL